MFDNLLIITKSTKYVDYLKYLGLKYENWNADNIDRFNEFVEKYSFIMIDNRGYILFAIERETNKQIVSYDFVSEYGHDPKEFKEKALVYLRKIKLKSLK
jgi:hypothetical protein